MLDFVDAKHGWIVDNNNELWATTNGGGKWTRIETTGLSNDLEDRQADDLRRVLGRRRNARR